ncbi:Maintenance of mitochondrial morphology protein 1 [Neolecta irregularis DAH-3]|uniref:Maintenance of mitochondrial morphology protein 1 n=1 Tax=Neolecta irregularis (strain DAH-3) TaxID=1198029 RepID=A0A1U7LHY8_NEOID|nr:Maintenance of mitochondrial morphology protein 1 [Neolecta irregularis DAH-3]|eukprot:OLL22267.1 Maintenance of mitochondrial morphology protein 1 [Neolecta irregularis DAH-3]
MFPFSPATVTVTHTVTPEPVYFPDCPVLDYLARISASQLPELSFASGILLGQLSFLIVTFIFVTSFVCGTAKKPISESVEFTAPKAENLSITPEPLLSNTILLKKTKYSVPKNGSESLCWLNVLVAQALTHFRDPKIKEAMVNTLENIMNGPDKPGIVEHISITRLELGNQFPIMSNCRVSSCGDKSEQLRVQIDIDFTDFITLGVETKVLLIGALPIALEVSLLRFNGTITIAFMPSTDSMDPLKPSAFNFNFTPKYRLVLDVRSVVGARSQFRNIPKISELVEGQIRSTFASLCVEPQFQKIAMPGFWSSEKEGLNPFTVFESDSSFEAELGESLRKASAFFGEIWY